MKVYAQKVLAEHDPTVGFKGEELPVGQYLTKLVRVEDKTSQDGKYDMLSMGFKVIEGDYEGRWTFISFFLDGTDEKLKQFTSQLFSSFGVNLRDYPDGTDATAIVTQFVHSGENPAAPTYVVKVTESKNINPKTNKPWVNSYISAWDGRSVASPKRGATPVIPGVGATATVPVQGAAPNGEVPIAIPAATPINRPVSPIAENPLFADQ